MEHLSFDDLQLFARLAALGSLSAVARERLVSVARLSRALERMERASGARLFARTPHGLSLTREGEVFLRGCTDARTVLEGGRLRKRKKSYAKPVSVELAAPVAVLRQMIRILSSALSCKVCCYLH